LPECNTCTGSLRTEGTGVSRCAYFHHNYPYPNNLRSRSQLTTGNWQLRRSRPSLSPSCQLAGPVRGKTSQR